MATVRVKPDVASVVFAPTGEAITLKTDMAFDSEDWVVLNHPWAFEHDADTHAPTRRKTSVRVEQATAAPGESR